MICKLSKGAGFRGCLNYLMRSGKPEKDTASVIKTNMAGATPRELAAEFGMFRRLRPTLSKAVFHASLSMPPTDPMTLTDDQLGEVAERFLREMGFAASPYIVIKHTDTRHKHCHIVSSRIDGEGNAVSDAKDYQRAESIMREIEKDYGLYTVLPKRASPPQPTRRKRRSTMNEEQKKAIEERLEGSADAAEIDHREMLGQSPVADSVTCADVISDKGHREARRIIQSDEYEAALRVIFSDEIRHIYRAAPGLVIYFKDKGRLHDLGNRIVTYKMNPKESARRIIELCCLRQWKKITLAGSDEFIMEAMRLAIEQGIEITPTSEKQKEMLMAILAERGGYPSIALLSAPHIAQVATPQLQPTSTSTPPKDFRNTLLPPPKLLEPEPAPSAFGEEIARKLALRRKQEEERIQKFRKPGGPKFG